MTFLRHGRAALVFLTRLPVGGEGLSAEDFRWAPAYFPLVGALIGAFTAAVLRALQPLGPLAASLFALGASMLLTGAIHEDGFADTADALGGGQDREKVLAILKDSRIGAYGAAALVVSIFGRACLLSALGASVWGPLMVVGACSRLGPLWLMVAMPYAGSSAVTKSEDVRRAQGLQAVFGSVVTVLVLAAAVPAFGLAPSRIAAVLVLGGVATGFLAWRFWRRLGGITGDFLGATEQALELTGLAVFCWGLS